MEKNHCDYDEFLQTEKEKFKMTRKEIERVYNQNGLEDYQLKTLDDLKAVHGIDVTEIKGYSGLTDENRQLFDSTVISFFNVLGLDSRMELRPTAIHYVEETEYDKTVIEDDEEYDVDVGIVVQSIDRDGKKQRLHRYVFEKDIPFTDCKKSIKKYLRFELKNNLWFHITENGEWY